MPPLVGELGAALLGSTLGACLGAAALGPEARSLLPAILVDWIALCLVFALLARRRERSTVVVRDDRAAKPVHHSGQDVSKSFEERSRPRDPLPRPSPPAPCGATGTFESGCFETTKGAPRGAEEQKEVSAETENTERPDSDAPESEPAEENGFTRAVAAWADYEATLRRTAPARAA